ncbi:hypothetical protein ACE6H2_001936 [Prunus campanulata]
MCLVLGGASHHLEYVDSYTLCPQDSSKTMLHDYKFANKDEEHEVNADDVTNLLQHIAGLNALLFSTCLKAASQLTRLGNKKEERSKNKHDHAGNGKAPMLKWEDDEEEEDEDDEENEEEEEGEDKNEEDDGHSDLGEDNDENGTDIDTIEDHTLKRPKRMTNKSVRCSRAKRRKNKQMSSLVCT